MLTVAQAAKKAGCHTNTIRHWITKGLATGKGSKGQTVVDAKDLDRFIAEKIGLQTSIETSSSELDTESTPKTCYRITITTTTIEISA